MIAPPFGEAETMILSAIDLADDALGDPDIEMDQDGEPSLGWCNPGGRAPLPDEWSISDPDE
jgi:hypothetical protein